MTEETEHIETLDGVQNCSYSNLRKKAHNFSLKLVKKLRRTEKLDVNTEVLLLSSPVISRFHVLLTKKHLRVGNGEDPTQRKTASKKQEQNMAIRNFWFQFFFDQLLAVFLGMFLISAKCYLNLERLK